MNGSLRKSNLHMAEMLGSGTTKSFMARRANGETPEKTWVRKKLRPGVYWRRRRSSLLCANGRPGG